MRHKIQAFLMGGRQPQPLHLHIGFLLLRFFVGLALCTVFEKFLPRNGIWGPQEWFIQDTANMGFPFPVFFAWVAVLTEFVGGILLMLGLFTRPAALLNVFVTFTATFIYHGGDIGNSGLLSFFFMIMCTCILLFGPGKFSIDFLLHKKLTRSIAPMAAMTLLLLAVPPANGQVQSTPEITTADKTEVYAPVTFYVKNNSLLPRTYTFILYQPQQEGNNTRVKWMLPFQRVPFTLPETSTIYIATDRQVDRVMQGQRIDGDEPFVLVTEDVRDTTLKLRGGEGM